MPAFKVNQSLETTVSRLQVETQTATDTSGATTLRPGVHHFKLVVVNDKGVQSAPAFAEVRVTQPLIVQPIVQPIIAQPIVAGPQVVLPPPEVINRIPGSDEIGGSPLKKRRQPKRSKPAGKSKSSKKAKPAAKSKSSEKPKSARKSKSSKKAKPAPKR